MAHLDTNSGSVIAVAAASSHSHVIDMPQLDASSRSAVAAATDHSHAIDTSGSSRSSCSAGDDKCSTGSDDIPSCAVCMEPLEWVAVGPCGHRVVCSGCAARFRSTPKPDHLCCICRTLCPTVLVTKAAVAAAADGELSFSEMPVATGQDGQVGDYWYCAAMSAYFDDEEHYEATAKAAAAACLKQRPHGAIDGERAQRYGTPQFLKYSFFAALFGVCIGFVFAVDAPGWGGRVGIVAGCAALSVAVGSVLWFLKKYGYI